jgi:HlyD family secretion protein
MTKASGKTRLIPALLVAAGLIGGALAWWHYRQGDDLPAGLARANGRLEMTRSDVAVKYPGRLLAVEVQEGDAVQAGQEIARQDETDALVQLAGAQATRERAVAALARAQGEAAARGDQAGLARIDLREAGRLKDQAMVSPVEVEQRRLAADAAQAATMAAGGGVGEARAAIRQADAQIAQLKATLADLRIRAPVAGRVEYRIVEPGTMLAPGGRVVSLVNPLDVYLTVFLPAAVAGQVHLGDEARILPEGFTDAIPARISFVAPEAQFTPNMSKPPASATSSPIA